MKQKTNQQPEDVGPVHYRHLLRTNYLRGGGIFFSDDNPKSPFELAELERKKQAVRNAFALIDAEEAADHLNCSG